MLLGFITSLTLLIISLFVLTACSTPSKMLGAPVTGYNHTSAAINWVSVNGAGGGNVGPHQGGGSEVCCGMVPRFWVPGLRAIVEWETDPDPFVYRTWKERTFSDAWNNRLVQHEQHYSRHKAVVDIPQYTEAGTLKVHFLPCNQVRVSADNIRPGEPRYPYNYPMQMDEPKVCPGS